MVVFDTSTILLSIDPHCLAPLDPGTKLPVTHCKERVDNLLITLSGARVRVLIPTPVLSEFLVNSGPNKQQFLDDFLRSPNFVVGPFDTRSAIELAYLTEAAARLPRKKLTTTESKAKLKFDRQVIAIARVNGATTLYTDDKGLADLAKNNGIVPVLTWQLALPKVTLSLFPLEETTGDSAAPSSA